MTFISIKNTEKKLKSMKILFFYKNLNWDKSIKIDVNL